MEKHDIPPPEKKDKKPAGPEEKDEIRENKAGKNADGSEEKTADDGAPSREEVVSRWSDPVTNQDEQEKITNTGGNDIPTQEK